MSIEREGSKIIFECDSCPNRFVGEPHEEFVSVLAAAKRKGWKAKKYGHEWVHGCPKCGV